MPFQLVDFQLTSTLWEVEASQIIHVSMDTWRIWTFTETSVKIHQKLNNFLKAQLDKGNFQHTSLLMLLVYVDLVLDLNCGDSIILQKQYQNLLEIT